MTSDVTSAVTSAREPVRRGVHGVPPLDGRLEPWMHELLGDPDGCARLVAEHGSPLNVLNFSPVARNATELVQEAAEHGVAARVFVARKANKALGLVDAALRAGLGVDVASLGELTQCLDAGVGPGDLIVSAAVKAEPLLRTCVEHDVPVSLDNADEAADLVELARAAGRRTPVGLRIGVVDARVAPTRFGQRPQAWLDTLAAMRDDVVGASATLSIEGVHFHLNGYSAAERAIGLRVACRFVDDLRAAGHPVRWIDVGGGVPMTYLDDEQQWRAFWHAVDGADGDEVTWRGDRLGLVDPDADRPSPALYPYWQDQVRGAWLLEVLAAPAEDGTDATVADLLRDRDLELRLEPGRSMLDGCGVTLAKVAFRKESSDGVPLVGLHMNRTQVRSTSLDFLVDPVWVRPSDAGEPNEPGTGFLVGAYCVEEELLLRRRLAFPQGVARGDLAAFVNTGGYLMHILESASHQLPLARTLTWQEDHFVPDRIDALTQT